MRNMGIEIIGEAPWGTHFCQFYRERHDLIDILVPYFKAGLESNEACMWITSPDLTTAQAKAALRYAVPNLDDYIKSGQLEILPHTKWYLKGGAFELHRVLNGWIEKLKAAQTHGFDGLRLSGNTVWLEKKDWSDFIDYERVINETIGQYPMIALCTYNLNRCGAVEVLDVVRHHQFAIIRNEQKWEIIESFDATQARKAVRESEEQLRASEEKFSKAFANNPAALALTTLEEGIFLDVNETWVTLSAYSREELIGKSARKLGIWPAAEPIKRFVDELRETGRFQGREQEFRKKSGEGYIVQLSAQLLDVRGEKVILSTMIDIAERKRAEEALAAAHEQALNEKKNLEALMAALPVGVAIVDEKGGNLQANRMYKEVWGEAIPDSRGVEDYDKYKAWRIDTGEPVKPEDWAAARAVLAGESVVGQFFRIQRFDGRFACVINSAVPIRDAEGRISGSAVAIQDVTEQMEMKDALRKSEESLRESEERLRLAIRASELGTFDFDPKSGKLEWDARCKELFGLTPEAEVDYQIFMARLHPDDREQVKALVERTFDPAGDGVFDLEYRTIGLRDRTERWLRAIGRAVFDGTGRATRFIGTVQDVSAQKQYEQKLRESEERASAHAARLQAILNAAPAIIWMGHGRNCKTITGNQAAHEFSRLAGVPEGEQLEHYRVFREGVELTPEEMPIQQVAASGEPLNDDTLEFRFIDGSSRHLIGNVIPVMDSNGQPDGAIAAYVDATDLFETESSLRENREYLKVTLSSIGDAVIAADLAGTITFFNKVAATLTGWPEIDAVGKPISEIFRIHNEETGRPSEDIVARVLKGGSIVGLANHTMLVRRDGGVVPIEDSAAPILDNDGNVAGVVLVFHDVTEKRRVQEALRASEQEIHLVMDTVPALIAYVGSDLRYRRVNKTFESWVGRSASEIVGRSVRDIVGPRMWQALKPQVDRVLAGETVTFEQRLEYASAAPWSEVTLVPDHDGGGKVQGYVAHMTDITERKRAAAELAESRRRLAMILDSIADGFYALDRDWRFIHINDTALSYFGMARESLIGRSIWEAFPKMAGSGFEAPFRKAMETGEPVHFIQRSVVVPDKIAEMNAYPGADNLTVLFRDVTERIHREAELQRLNRTLSALSHSDRAMMRATDEPSYLTEVCRIVTENCGHAMVWIGCADNNESKTVRPVASAGFEEGYLDTLRITWADSERGRGPTGTAIRTGRPIICHNMLTDPQFEPWRKEATRRGYSSSLALPLIVDGNTIGAITIYSRLPDAFSEQEISLLTRLADDLAYGIMALRLKVALQSSEEIARRRAEEVEKLMNLAPNAIWVAHDPECRTITGNLEANRFYESGQGENVSAGPVDNAEHDTTRRFFHNGRELEPGELPMQLCASTGESVVNSELDVLLPSGRVINMLGNAAPLFDEEGRVRGSIASFLDITARTRAESELKYNLSRLELLAGTAGQLLQAPEPQQVIDSLCRRVMEHLNCEAFFNFLIEEPGYLRLNACAGIPDEAARSIERLKYGVAVCGCVARDGCRIIAEHIPTTPDPRTELIKTFGIKAYACHPLLGPGGKVVGTLSFGAKNRETFAESDISLMKAISDQVAVAINRMQIEKDLRQSQAELVDLNRTLEKRIVDRTCQLDRVNADLERRAHQLRALAQELTETEERERRRIADILHDDLQQVLVGAKLHVGILPSRVADPVAFRELLSQITDMLDESIGKSRGMAHELSPPLLRQQGLVATLEWLCRQMKMKYGLDVRLTADPHIEPSDALKVFLFRAAQEMLFNVVKHAGVGEAEIVLEQPADVVRLTVADSGKGFEAPSGTPTDWGTSGFGLFSIHERANLLGGNLRIESASGQGSRFILEIPLESDEHDNDENAVPMPGPSAAHIHPDSAGKGEKPLRVLLADDHQVMRQGLMAMLQNARDIVVVGEAEDGREAVDMIPKCRPDVVIMDISMPIMDGIDATRRIKREWPDLRVIGLSMFEEEDLAETMLDAGAESYLSKVLGLKELVDVIRKTKPGIRKAKTEKSGDRS